MDQATWLDDVHKAQDVLKKAPGEELLTVYAQRVRSRGELGVLSSLNQKLWQEYADLELFLDGQLGADCP